MYQSIEPIVTNMLVAQTQITDGQSWPSISFGILIFALVLSIYILWRRYQSRRLLIQRITELETLSEAGRTLVAAELDITALCELIAAESEKVIDNRTFQVGLFSGSLYKILFWQINHIKQETPCIFNLADNGGVVGWMQTSKQPLLVRDFLKEIDSLPARPRYISETPPRSAIFIPLISGERVIGIIAAQHSLPNRFTEEDLRRLMILANQAAAAIAHADLFAQERRRAAHLELVGQIARQLNNIQDLDELFKMVVTLTQNTFAFDPVSIFLVTPDSNQVALQASSNVQLSPLCLSLSVGDGLVGTAVSTQQTIISNNTSEDPRFLSHIQQHTLTDVSHIRSEMAIPLIANKEVLGVLDVQSSEFGSFSKTDEQTLAALAAEIATAIEKARRLAQQRVQAWITTAQFQVAETISRNPQLDEMVTAVDRLLSILLGTPFSCIYLWQDDEQAYQLTCFNKKGNGNINRTPPSILKIGTWTTFDAAHVGEIIRTTDQIPTWLSHIQPSTITIVPMKSGSQLVGMLIVAEDQANETTLSTQTERYKQLQQELLLNIATQTAQAIESGQLRMAQQEEAWVNTALLQVAEAVNSLIDLNEILATIVRLVPMLVGVESALILIWDEERQLFHAGPSYGISQMGRGLLETLEIDRDEFEQIIPGRMVNVMPQSTPSPYSLRLPHWLREVFGTPSAHALPLNSQGRLVGMMVIGVNLPNGRFLSPRRLNILNGIAHQAATAVVNNQLYKESAERSRLEQELNVAREIQTSLIPPGNPAIPGCNVASFWQAARQVSGDFYDFVELSDDKWGIVIADVADKGIPAALFMALSRTIIRTIAYNRVDPASTLMRVNQIIDSETQTDLFVTVFYAVWDAKFNVLTYANAGHNPPLLFKKKGENQLLSTQGMALGVLPDVTIEQKFVQLDPGDTVIYYTDGVTEAMNEDYDEFGMQRLETTARNNHQRTAHDILEAITQRITAHAGDTPQFDDITLVIMKRDLDV
ncbi:MAG: SpoIIE family protein phosphatase [Chloroflexi bacterium]|nr:SpoIIE family protein phosphatase [Chloroflexota bacterium]